MDRVRVGIMARSVSQVSARVKFWVRSLLQVRVLVSAVSRVRVWARSVSQARLGLGPCLR